jgi:glyoxylase-like metal-dependent hydrolase (beta-lactamase superfamily II)
VDAGASRAHAAEFRAAMDAAGLPPVTFVALTHWHWDHVFGTAAFDVPTFAHGETARRVAWMSGLDWSDAALDARVGTGEEIAFCRDMIRAELPDRSGLTLRVPDVTFGDGADVTVDLGGGVTCRLLHVGGDHAADSVAVHVPGDRVAFLGDAIYYTVYEEPRRYTAARLFPLLDRLLALDAEHYLAGHDTEPMTHAAFAEFAEQARVSWAVVERHGPGADRRALLDELVRTPGAPTDRGEAAYFADSFVAGLRASTGASVVASI